MRAPSSRPRAYRLDALRFHAFRVQSLLATDGPGVGAIVLCALILFWSGLTRQVVAYERDTYAFYMPLTDWFAEQLRAGHFALWTPLVFGGYPLFADGEIGVFYPLNLLLLPFVPADLLLTPLRALHLVVVGVGMMHFLRALGLGRPGAVVGGIVFGYCGFLVAQIAHENVVRTAVWLPWILLCVERGLQGRGNVRSLVLGGLVAAVAMLGVHIQPVIMIALATLLFAAWRLFVAADRVATLSPIRRLVLLAGTPILVFGIGLGIAAIQWLPLWELAKLSPRGEGFDPNAALAIGLRWQNFATLLFPQLFRLDDGRSLLLWDDWEGMLFVGVVSLGLLPIALHRGDRRRCAFFGGLGLLAFLAACGDASPLPVARWLLYLPGMSLVRIPARYTFLVTFAAAGLAAEGANAVASVRGRSRGLVVSGAGVLAATVAVAFAVLLLRDQLLVDPGGWKQRISDGYVAVPNARTYLSTDLVYGQLVRGLDPTRPTVGGSLGLLAGLGVLLVVWGLRPQQRSWWVGLLILLVGVDALRYGLPFHPRGRLDQLMQPPKVLDLVKAHEQPVRVLVATRDDTVLANRLAGAQIQTLDGYSSLPDGRNLAYVGHLFDGGTSLLDLAAVRYLVVDRELVTPPDDENGVARAESGSVSKELRAFVQSAALPVIAADQRLAVLENLHSFNRASHYGQPGSSSGYLLRFWFDRATGS